MQTIPNQSEMQLKEQDSRIINALLTVLTLSNISKMSLLSARFLQTTISDLRVTLRCEVNAQRFLQLIRVARARASHSTRHPRKTLPYLPTQIILPSNMSLRHQLKTIRGLMKSVKRLESILTDHRHEEQDQEMTLREAENAEPDSEINLNHIRFETSPQSVFRRSVRRTRTSIVRSSKKPTTRSCSTTSTASPSAKRIWTSQG